MTTPYHSKIWANLLTLQGGEGANRLGRTLGSARVDLNPHQVHAAVFALQTVSLGGGRGALLADEVGLGKTIEAGLVMAQCWAEGRRRILVIVPAMLRKQWQAELADKFHLDAEVIEAASLQRADLLGAGKQILVCSYQFAARQAVALSRVTWDLVVLDEAHRMRGASRGAVMAQAIQQAIAAAPRVLLTATPLQNSLLELHGISQLLDPHLFGDLASFKAQFVRATSDRVRDMLLRERMQRVCVRTLRRQVQEYVRFTRRVPMTQPFMPSQGEQSLYEDVSDWLRQPVSVALPQGQRSLLTMVLRKLLASSTHAIAATLRQLIARVEQDLPEAAAVPEDFEAGDDAMEDWRDVTDAANGAGAGQPIAEADVARAELRLLRSFADRAEKIASNAKGDALILALKAALAKAAELGAQRKAVVFTESRKTQAWLRRLLESNGYQGQVVLINGTNTDPESKATHEAWVVRHRGDGQVSGVRSADMRAALVEKFRDDAVVLLATEAAAEGVNLQFCSLVVNYDLPWNPQRVEQRIGRCHRYGQAHDVVVVNFLNQRNAADQRVLQLLTDKFQLFEGVFGASDEVLGALGGGVDLEKRIADIYQKCRTAAEIHTEFDALQDALRPLIEHKLAETREQILSHFDAEVQERLRVHRDQAKTTLDQRQRWFLDLLRSELGSDAVFARHEPAFLYVGDLAPDGDYHLDWRAAEAEGGHFLSQDHPLAQELVRRALVRTLAPARLVFRFPNRGRVARLAPHVGRHGWLAVDRLTIQGAETDEFLLTAAVTDDGVVLDAEVAERLWELLCDVEYAAEPDATGSAALGRVLAEQAAIQHAGVRDRQARRVDEEADKLSSWAEDEKLGLRLDIERLDQEIGDLQRQVRQVETLEARLALRRRERDIDRQRTERRRALFEAQDRVDAARDELIGKLEAALAGTEVRLRLFSVRWHLMAA